MYTKFVSAVVILGAVFSSAVLADAPPPPAADRFAPQAADAKNNAGFVQTWLGNLMDNANQVPIFTRDDRKIITADVQVEIDAWNDAAAAWQEGDQAKAEKVTNHARELGSRRGAWQSRIDWRQRQAREAPSEETMNQVCGWRYWSGVAMDCEARKRLADTCGRMADAQMPGVDPKVIAALDDAVFAAQLEVDVAEMKMTWITEDHNYAMRDAVSSPGLTAAQKALDDGRAQHEAIYRKIRLEQRQLDMFDKTIGPLLSERDNQAELARQKRDQPR